VGRQVSSSAQTFNVVVCPILLFTPVLPTPRASSCRVPKEPKTLLSPIRSVPVKDKTSTRPWPHTPGKSVFVVLRQFPVAAGAETVLKESDTGLLGARLLLERSVDWLGLGGCWEQYCNPRIS
jgi:hypothetical protein